MHYPQEAHEEIAKLRSEIDLLCLENLELRSLLCDPCHFPDPSSGNCGQCSSCIAIKKILERKV